jgi:hypothetical protein
MRGRARPASGAALQQQPARHAHREPHRRRRFGNRADLQHPRTGQIRRALSFFGTFRGLSLFASPLASVRKPVHCDEFATCFTVKHRAIPVDGIHAPVEVRLQWLKSGFDWPLRP